ncbi:hypothetical protein ACPF8X_05130 [Streptomyces sp. G35A]
MPETLLTAPRDQVSSPVKSCSRTLVRQARPFGYQVGLFRLWQALGIDATAVTGHGVGALAAAHLAGAHGLRDAAHRTLTQEDCPGAADRPGPAGPGSARRPHPEGFSRLLWCGPVQETPVVAGDPWVLLAAFRHLQGRGPETGWNRLMASGTASGPLEESGLSSLSA